IPDNLAFRQQFVNICYEFSDTQIIQDTIYESSIRKDFGKNAEARAYIAERHLFSMLDVENPEFEEAVKNSVNEFQQSVETAASLNLVSEKMYVEWIEWFLESHDSNSKNALEIAKQATDIYPQSSELWIKRIDVVMSLEELQDKSVNELYGLALKNNPASVVLWDSYLSWNLSKWKDGGLEDHELEK
ncbi:1991_t:CDS:2, partial [Racocetra fulgida]